MKPRERALRLGGAVVGLSALLTGLTGIAVAATGEFAPVPETGTPGLLRLHTDPEELYFDGLSAGQTVYGQVRVDLDQASWGDMALEMRVSGELASAPNGISVGVQKCDVAWNGIPEQRSSEDSPTCAEGQADIVHAGPADDFSRSSPVWPLGRMTDARNLFLLVTVEMSDDAWDESLMGLSADFAFLVTAEGDESGQIATANPGPGPSDDGGDEDGSADDPGLPQALAQTGANLVALGLIAGGILLLGAVLRRRGT